MHAVNRKNETVFLIKPLDLETKHSRQKDLASIKTTYHCIKIFLEVLLVSIVNH